MNRDEILKIAADSYLQGQKDMIQAMRDALDMLDRQIEKHEADTTKKAQSED